MCGIVGHLGCQNTKGILLNGLAELEYRGYDSAGIAVLNNKDRHIFKAVGKLENLKEKTTQLSLNEFSVGIGHTRWATHGKPTEENAHPHYGSDTYIVHNGIIENYQELKTVLQKDGFTFVSQTDTEVFVHLFEKYQKNHTNNYDAFKSALSEIEGAYAILLITDSDPETIYFAKKGSPLILGLKGDEKYFASSDAALLGQCSDVHFFEDGEFGYVTRNEVHIESVTEKQIKFQNAKLPSDKLSAQKEGYRFFMEKEIYEQADVLADTLRGRVLDTGIEFDELDENLFDGISEIKLCACGTSYHAALTSSYLFERLAKIKSSVEIASEFRYKEPLLTKDTLFLAISQSGETADTLEALKMAKQAGLKTLSICNVDNSSIVRLSDASILTRAGIEKGVASTKAFATQVAVLWMLSLYVAQFKKSLDTKELQNELHTLREVPNVTVIKDAIHEKTKRLAKRYLHGHGFFFIGRDVFYPLALEGALKLKEISYLHAEGYPAGEMKHGPIALADPELFTIALLSENLLFEKTKSNMEELGARDSTICCVSSYMYDKADDFIVLPKCNHYMLEFYEMMTATQLLAMEIAIKLENDVDMPRNLAKSVTVE
ncbi:glutamine--fructose-6-phosphate transaminase (isomerizing) [Sulfurimonas marina]|uniref:Glutamine--fructose-6-phosphate aminotransferase [isomerizing] n=1 Tax=Sulfurimonas marina TaxID=2590551 RepID=A0A7M1AVF6_9BACT|nr:glutamine--fructose-6-phosphate transaminase (isomerizing) [Sulfurimonas marina]QOP41441.1 glutamine--fructose-6-phosphate transaminase (isomerizing) [Sulfurimonas marina]